MSYSSLTENHLIHPCNLIYYGSEQSINQKSSNDAIGQSNSTQKIKPKERTRIKSEVWNSNEINKIFTLYNQYGSQWKILQSEFPERNANSIKNRFYTVIRILLKLLFKWHPLINEKIPNQIPSKLILKFYEGRQEFSPFKGFGKRILKMIKYDLESKQIRKISQQNSQQIQVIYNIIFDKNKQQEQSTKKQEKKSKISKLKEQINENNNNQNNEYKIDNNQIHQKIINIKPQTTSSIDQVQLNYCPNSLGNNLYFIHFPSFYNVSMIQPYYQQF